MAQTKFQVKAILLDLDGTIVDSKEAYIEAFKRTWAKMQLDNFDSKLAFEIPRKLEQNIPINDIVQVDDVEGFLEIYREEYYHVTAEKTKLIPKIAETLEKLSKKARLALITMRFVPRKRIMLELEKFGIANYFEYVVTALDTHTPKPSPEALIKCANQMNVQTCDCLIVGDSVADVKAGKRAEIVTVAVLSGIFSREELEAEKPDLILESVDQLPDFLE